MNGCATGEQLCCRMVSRVGCPGQRKVKVQRREGAFVVHFSAEGGGGGCRRRKVIWERWCGRWEGNCYDSSTALGRGSDCGVHGGNHGVRGSAIFGESCYGIGGTETL